MSNANLESRIRILPAMHPVRIARPDNVIRCWLVTSLPAERVQVRRHWNREHGVTEVCQCDPACQSMREDYFTGALQSLPGVSRGENVFEPVVLHLTETTVRGIYTHIRTRNDNGDLAGIMACLRRQGAGSGRVVVASCTRHHLTHSRPVIDVSAVVLARLRLSTDFFSRQFDMDDGSAADEQVIPPARSRSEKPRVPLGKK